MIRPGSLATPRDSVSWGGLKLQVGRDSLHTVVGPATAGYGGCRAGQARQVNASFTIGDKLYMRLDHLKPIGSGFGSWYKEHS